MRQPQCDREKMVYKLSQTHPWYRYEWEKKRLSSKNREAEVKSIAKRLKI